MAAAKQIPFDPSQTLYIVDISSFIFRAFFAIRSLTNRNGEPTNAVYGVASMMARLVEEANPRFLAVAYDSKEPSFRKQEYDAYKANRSAPPEDLIPQFARVDELVAAMQIHSFRLPGVEADDLIATMAQRWCEESPEHRVVVVTGDKDLMQLVNDRIVIWDTMKDKIFRESDVVEKFGVPPNRVRDYLAMVGDSSDNIPGVPSIGPKSAADLVRDWGDLDGILEASKAGKITGKKGQVLAENEELARLSLRLVTLKSDVEMRFGRADYEYAFSVSPACEAFLLEMDFKTLLAKWREKSPSVSAAPVQSERGKFVTITEKSEFDSLLKQILKKGEFAVDLETTSLNPRLAQIVGVALSVDSEVGYYIPLQHQTDIKQLPFKEVLQTLKPILENPKIKKRGQNLKYDMSVFLENGIELDGIGVDTMVAGYLLQPGSRTNMDALSRQYLNYEPVSYESVCGKGKDQITFDQVPVDLATRYSAEDALCVNWLWDAMWPGLEKDGLMPVFAQVEMPLVPLLARMECQGVCIDVPWLNALSGEFEKRLAELQTQVEAYAGAPINLHSPKQLGVLLFEQLKLPTQSRTKTGYSTDATVLEALGPLHEVPRLLLEFREIAKLKGTYVDPLPQMIDPKTGKIHASFHQTVAATGRLSSSDPNLQNIPVRTERGQKIRRAFIPSPGNQLISADYSQIELRLLAHLSDDPDLIASFLKDEDIHRRTASEIFGRPVSEINDAERSVAKAINFGLMYGKTPFGLAAELGIPRAQAKDMIDKYFTRYAAVKKLLDGQIEQARQTGVVNTLLGRRRQLPDIHSKNMAVRNNAERMAMNTPIQGTAADLMKLAMIRVENALRQGKYRAKIIIQVHDELVLDCPREEVKAVTELVVREMESAQKFKVPLRVNASVGDNWMDL